MRNFTVSEYTAYVLVNSIFLWAFFCTQLRSARNPRTLADTKPNTPIKVIPLFCTAQTLLRIILRHPRWRRFFPLARKEQTRDAFAELKLSFAIIMPQIGWQLAGLLSETRKWKKCAWSRSVQWFFTSRPSTALRLFNCINEPVSGLGSQLYICCSNSGCGETNIYGTNKTHRGTRTTRERLIFDVNTNLLLNSHFAVYKNQTIEHMKNRNRQLFLQVSSSWLLRKRKEIEP